jgi:hypothetical protein
MSDKQQPPKKKAKTKAAASVAQPGMAAAMGASGVGAAAKGKAKSKAGAVNGRNAGAQGPPAARNMQGQVSSGGASPRLGYGPKMTAGQAKVAANPGREAAASKGAHAPRPGLAASLAGPQRPHPAAQAQQPPGNYKAVQGAGQMGAGAAGAPTPPGQVPAPIRVRQAFKWTFNLRKKAIDKSRVRRWGGVAGVHGVLGR